MTGCPGKNVDLPTFTCDAIFAWSLGEETPRLVSYGYVDPYGLPTSMGQRIVSLAKKWQKVGVKSSPSSDAKR